MRHEEQETDIAVIVQRVFQRQSFSFFLLQFHWISDSDRDNPDIVIWFVGLGMRFNVGNTDNCFHTFDHTAKHSVFIVQPRGWYNRDEELTSVGVGTTVGHAHGIGAVVLQFGMEFIFKFVSP